VTGKHARIKPQDALCGADDLELKANPVPRLVPNATVLRASSGERRGAAHANAIRPLPSKLSEANRARYQLVSPALLRRLATVPGKPRLPGDREAQLKQDGPSWSFWITFPLATVATTMASLVDDRRDDFTVKNLSQSVAGYFDARFTRAE
jgi:hypothetical protein